MITLLSNFRLVLIGLGLGLFVLGCEKEAIDYEATPTFVSEAEEFAGVEGKVGFLNGVYTANEPRKTLWHFWGHSDDINGAVRVEGTHLETGEKTPLLLDGYSFDHATWEFDHGFTQPNLGATKTMPSYVGFEKPGFWEVSVYTNGNHIGDFIVDVKE